MFVSRGSCDKPFDKLANCHKCESAVCETGDELPYGGDDGGSSDECSDNEHCLRSGHLPTSEVREVHTIGATATRAWHPLSLSRAVVADLMCHVFG